MAMHNLDDQLAEYFSFIVGGHQYRFRHMTTDEIKHLQTLEGDEQKGNEYLFEFISPEDPESPPFADIQKKMILPQWVKFRKMIQTEFGA